VEPLQRYLDFATGTAFEAGRLTLGFFQRPFDVETKADGSPVTEADRQAEALIRRRIERQFPSHSVAGEEQGAVTGSDAVHRWVIDPIDGTRSFVRGIPTYAVLLGLEIEGEPRVGVAHFPALGETIAAADGCGCWWNGRRARVSDVRALRDASLAHADAACFERPGRAEPWARLRQRVRSCIGSPDAYGYALVATGRAELALDPVLDEWDCAPYPPIMREAGGFFGDWRGRPTVRGGEGLATTSALLAEVLQAIAG